MSAWLLKIVHSAVDTNATAMKENYRLATCSDLILVIYYINDKRSHCSHTYLSARRYSILEGEGLYQCAHLNKHCECSCELLRL